MNIFIRSIDRLIISTFIIIFGISLQIFIITSFSAKEFWEITVANQTTSVIAGVVGAFYWISISDKANENIRKLSFKIMAFIIIILLLIGIAIMTISWLKINMDLYWIILIIIIGGCRQVLSMFITSNQTEESIFSIDLIVKLIIGITPLIYLINIGATINNYTTSLLISLLISAPIWSLYVYRKIIIKTSKIQVKDFLNQFLRGLKISTGGTFSLTIPFLILTILFNEKTIFAGITVMIASAAATIGGNLAFGRSAEGFKRLNSKDIKNLVVKILLTSLVLSIIIWNIIQNNIELLNDKIAQKSIIQLLSSIDWIILSTMFFIEMLQATITTLFLKSSPKSLFNTSIFVGIVSFIFFYIGILFEIKQIIFITPIITSMIYLSKSFIWINKYE